MASPTVALSSGKRIHTSAQRRQRVVVSPNVSVGALLLLLIICVGIAAPWLTTFDPQAVAPEQRLEAPGGLHLAGTDNFGRDLFSRTVFGARVSLLVGSVVALLSTLLGTALGLIAGYYPRMDRILMRLMDSLMAFPAVVLAVAIMAAVGPQVSNVIIALTVVYLPRIARLVRSVVLVVREMQYIEAARCVGLRDRRILVRHVLPNCLSVLTVQSTFIFAEAVLAEAALSFLGVGTPPYIPSWGIILGEARTYIRDAPWMMLLPGLALSVTVLGLNLLGDGLRDVLDPRQRRSVRQSARRALGAGDG
ncbi:MAG: ABC transporter permease [Chloroflexota bacterium]